MSSRFDPVIRIVLLGMTAVRTALRPSTAQLQSLWRGPYGPTGPPHLVDSCQKLNPGLNFIFYVGFISSHKNQSIIHPKQVFTGCFGL